MNGMKTIRALRAFPYSLDGVTVCEAAPGDTITIRAGAADALVAEHYAELEAVAPAQSPAGDAPVQGSAAESVAGSTADTAGGSTDTVTAFADGETAPADMAAAGGTNSRAARAAGTARARNAAS